MATDVAEELKAQHGDHETSAPAKGKLKKKLLIGGIVLLVITAQAIITAVLLPHPAASDGGHKNGDKEHAVAAPDAHEAPGHHDGNAAAGDVAEVSLGDFSFSNTTAAPGTIMHVDFKLSAVSSSSQASNLEAQVKLHTARIRQAVNKIVRSSNLEELNDPNLGTIKRLAREEINRLLTKSYVNEIVISDVRIMEQ